ncbi:MAG: EAL domain-containing protein [Dokdonella sp.]|jgi:diguanylate cyclase (GGDEF)-like protein/PAS domain S-box-containing protein|uniref:EAL domain-containing response regulator n=1 Tax=Dokdonella sp. TaxID=2291710 RepID=UPI001B5EC7A4|nr:EAL domain-containing protein [Dokdonella sp.]MBK8124930.1 EAL domain-containing protein [Dokdonella sp.]MBP6326602.1 EAL domain-containing protein [Dokdonella sp.]MBP6328699.1 EAL domain-containing protein [Dokdonella sp.]HNV07704.1 EAL domain-containing protein [Dokdonella sp.]HQV48029.1 EAL domain-containing protein [Dokdonella sp.]
MSKPDNVIKLLLIEDSVDEAEQIISMLRNGGIALRPTRAANEAELEDLLERQPPDMILANLGSRDLPLRQAAEAVNRCGKDISMIVYGSNLTDNQVVEAFQHGARGLALQNRADHLQVIVRREFEALTMRRSVRRLENALRESERRCSDLLDSSRDPIAYVHEGMHVRANRAYLETFGYEDFEDIESMSILDMVAADDAEDFKALLKKLSKGERPPQKLNLKAQRGDGSTFDAVMEFAEAMYEGEPCQQIVFRQQAVDAVASEELEELRTKDLITDLFNRKYLTTELDRVVAAANAGTSDQALILLELDNYKTVLDGIGLGNTDLLLGDMANLMKRHLKETDIAGRLGEHTFGIIVCERNAEAVAQLTEALRKAFEERIFEVGKNSINLTISVAGSLIVESASNGNAVLDRASLTLRTIQAEGGNRARVFDPAAKDKEDAEKNRHWLKLIKDALSNDGYILFYQPVISLQGAEGEFYEVLLRMKGPKGEILPAFFMPIAEQHGLLPQLDRWVIGTAIKAIAEREQGGRKTSFFIKLSPQSLEDPGLLPWIALQLKNARQRGDALIFEMPESKVVTNLKPARAFVRGLEQLHCGFALEQFGSGLNSFQLLKHIPAHYLKIDRSYMADLPKNKENQERIKSMCDQAHNAGKLTVAEFVEDAASMAILFSCGMNFVQGNFLQEPEQVMTYDFGGS